ncbi:MAG: hypothetical protein AAF961_19975, partial [Planctomycetota bacterium]
MKTRLVLLSALYTSGIVGWTTRADADSPIPLIFDTDIGNDVDDVLALGVIHALQSRGECELLAVTITKDHPLAASFVEAVNTFYRRGDVPHHPLAEAYVLYNPPPHDRPTWDLTSVLYGIGAEREYFGLSEPGRVVVADQGMTRFEPTADGRHRYLMVTPGKKPRALEALVILSSQPPT